MNKTDPAPTRSAINARMAAKRSDMPVDKLIVVVAVTVVALGGGNCGTVVVTVIVVGIVLVTVVVTGDVVVTVLV